ncbi:unnamed protein product [Cyclocybe aegerita]|uniref:DUF6534 domain-containing protein n=1 Tax=Cyclocybe aegerita TaxID=1973307 RepID=A0A8S0XM94_CYCAE|nr:unnamed protein product [Cyclocybe aegerita]
MSVISPISLKGPAELAHGWMFIGFSLNVLLLGIMVTQVYLYYTQYKRDRLWVKIYVAALFVLDIFNTIFIFLYLYRALITFFGDVEYLQTADWLFVTDPATTGMIACMVHLFFAWRVFVLTKTWIYASFITAVAIAGGIASIMTAVEVSRTPKFVDFRNFKMTVIIWLAADAVGDVVITSVLVWHLPFNSAHDGTSKRKHKTGFQHSDMMVDRIIRVTIQTGLVTMIVASLDLLFFLIDPTGTHLLLNFPLSKLYSNSLMSSLNSRRGWNFTGASTRSGGTQSDIHVNTTSGLQRHLHISSGKKPNDMIDMDGGVFVHVESHELRDIPTGDKETFDEKPRTLGSEFSVERPVDTEKWAGDRSQWAR